MANQTRETQHTPHDLGRSALEQSVFLYDDALKVRGDSVSAQKKANALIAHAFSRIDYDAFILQFLKEEQPRELALKLRRVAHEDWEQYTGEEVPLPCLTACLNREYTFFGSIQDARGIVYLAQHKENNAVKFVKIRQGGEY